MKCIEKYEKYLLNMIKELDLKDIVEYRYNLILIFFKEKINFWILIRDFFDGFYIVEIFSLILKILFKLFE